MRTLLLIRPVNLLMIALTQAIVLICLGEYNYLAYNPLKTMLLIGSTVLIAAAGYIINDYFDVKIDMINKPHKVFIGRQMRRRWAILIHTSLNVIAVIMGLFVYWPIAIINFICAALLYKYSESWKKQYFIGNFVVALLSALSIFVVWIYIRELSLPKIIAYASFAFVITIIREVIKDIEDEKGDAHFQCRTMAIVLGMRKTKYLLFIVTALFIVGILFYSFMMAKNGGFLTMEGQTGKIFPIYLALAVVIPLCYFCISLISADTKKEFHKLSTMVKYIMLTGILSMFLV